MKKKVEFSHLVYPVDSKRHGEEVENEKGKIIVTVKNNIERH